MVRSSTGLRHVGRGEREAGRVGQGGHVTPSLPHQAWGPYPVKPLLPVFRHQPGITERSQRQRLCSLVHPLAIVMSEPAMPAALVVLLRCGTGQPTHGSVTKGSAHARSPHSSYPWPCHLVLTPDYAEGEGPVCRVPVHDCIDETIFNLARFFV